VAIDPEFVTMSVRDTRTFTAVVRGDAGIRQAVTWSVQEGIAGGSVSSTGLYTAPALPGTYHLIATSQADPSHAAMATIIVQAGNASGSIQ
jgi:chitinase